MYSFGIHALFSLFCSVVDDKAVSSVQFVAFKVNCLNGTAFNKSTSFTAYIVPEAYVRHFK